MAECTVIVVSVIPSQVAPEEASIDVYLVSVSDVAAPLVLYACTFLVYAVFADNPASEVDVDAAAASTFILSAPSSILNPLSLVLFLVHV